MISINGVSIPGGRGLEGRNSAWHLWAYPRKLKLCDVVNIQFLDLFVFYWFLPSHR